MAQQPHEATAERRVQVKALASVGVRQEDIAAKLGVTLPTLHKYYRGELDEGMADANETVVRRLFNMTETNVAAAIFWSKVRMGWSERHQVELSGRDGGPIRTQTVEAEAAVQKLMEKLAADKATGDE